MDSMKYDWGIAQLTDPAQLPNAIKQLTEAEGYNVYSIFPFRNALNMSVIIIVLNRVHVEAPPDPSPLVP